MVEIEKLGLIQKLGILTNAELNTKLQNTLCFVEFLVVKNRESIIIFSEMAVDTLNKSSAR